MAEDLKPDSVRPRITVAICAWNEADVLADAVASVMNQSLPEHEYDVVVVDNRSTDGTGRILEELRGVYGRRFRSCREEQPGLSYARNRALVEAKAPLVAFIDADALAEPAWLAAIVESFADRERVGAVGGPVRIRWDRPRPHWWDDRLGEAMNEFQPHDKPRKLEYPHYPYGTNLAVRVSAVRDLGGFDAGLGRCGSNLCAGEDGELCLRLERAGWEVRFVPDALVHHRTIASRLRRRYILKRAFNHGRSQYIVESRHGFESGRYLTWPGIAGRLLSAVLRFRVDLPFLKFVLFRIGYHYQRTLFGRRRGAGSIILIPQRL